MRRFGVCLGFLALGSALSFGQYTVSILSTNGFDQSQYCALLGDKTAGYAVTFSGSVHAMMWNKDGSQNTDLHSSNYGDTKVLGLSGTTQVGIGTDADDVVHALLWHGTASSVVDLQPANWDSTWAYGASDHGQVGSGYSGTLFGNGSKHALYWNGSASSLIDLHPAGAFWSEANGIGPDYEAGYVYGNGGSRPFLWHDTAESGIDLTPNGYGGGEVDAVGANRQVGYLYTPGSHRHATVWSGTANSYVDLHPLGYDESYANAVSWSGEYQVGYAMGYQIGDRAMLWRGSSGSTVDLSSYLSSLPYSFDWSTAYGVNDDGTIIGQIGDFNGNDYGVKWTPVPEPTSIFVIVLGLGFLARRRTK